MFGQDSLFSTQVPISRISATADRKELHVRDDADQQLLVFEMPGPATAAAWEESLLVARKKYAASFVVAYASKDAIRARAPETPPPRKRTPAQLRTPVNNIEYFPPNFEGLVLGCIDADFCK